MIINGYFYCWKEFFLLSLNKCSKFSNFPRRDLYYEAKRLFLHYFRLKIALTTLSLANIIFSLVTQESI